MSKQAIPRGTPNRDAEKWYRDHRPHGEPKHRNEPGFFWQRAICPCGDEMVVEYYHRDLTISAEDPANASAVTAKDLLSMWRESRKTDPSPWYDEMISAVQQSLDFVGASLPPEGEK